MQDLKEIIFSWECRWTPEEAGVFLNALIEKEVRLRREYAEAQEAADKARELAEKLDRSSDEAKRAVIHFTREWTSRTAYRMSPEGSSRFAAESEAAENKVREVLIEGAL
jgi:hypothetical protein